MAGGLSAFFAQNVAKPENKRFAVSDRFRDGKGEAAVWEARALTSGEDEALRAKHTSMVQITGKPGQYRQDFDSNGYLLAMAAACTVFPNLRDKELQDSYGVMGAEALLGAMLLPGEYAAYMQRLQELNGFKSMPELVDEAKN